MQKKQKISIIGRAERVDLPDFNLPGVPAKVDTGAGVSSIWATDVQIKDDNLEFKLFGPKSSYYSGETISLPPSKFALTRIENSFGIAELRYKVKLRVKIKNRLIGATFTLSDRSKKTYPILLGRRLLRSKFLVDVTSGKPLVEKERNKRKKLRIALQRLNAKLEKG